MTDHTDDSKLIRSFKDAPVRKVYYLDVATMSHKAVDELLAKIKERVNIVPLPDEPIL